MKRIYLLFMLAVFLIITVNINYAQGVSISDDVEDPHPSSILDLSSTNKGLLLPRMTTAQRDAIGSPAESLFIFNTETKCFEIFVEDVWHSLWCAEEDIEFNCGNTVNYEGHNYPTVQIGAQCWFAENLNLGSMIIGVNNQGTSCASVQKYCYDDLESNCNIYGGLYQWNQIMCGSTTDGAQGICPDGWRIPTDEDWKILEGTVDATYGTGDIEWEGTGWRGDDAGCELRTSGTTHWTAPNTCATNNSGFSALPGGYRTSSTGSFSSYQGNGYWWTSTQNGDNAYMRFLSISFTGIYRNSLNKVVGHSVRCIKND